jgi:hypothetical protein
MNARLLFTLLAVSILFGACTDGYGQETAGKRLHKSPNLCWTIDAMAEPETSTTHLDFEYSEYFLDNHLPKDTGKGFHWEALPEDSKSHVTSFAARGRRPIH